MLYLDKLSETYDKTTLLFTLTKLKRHVDFIVIGESAVTMHCGLPSSKIEVCLLSEWKKPVESLRSIKVEGSILKVDKINILNTKLIEELDFTIMKGFKVELLETLISNLNDIYTISRLIQENHLSRQFVTNIRDKGKNSFVDAYESLYGVQNKDVWNKLLKE